MTARWTVSPTQAQIHGVGGQHGYGFVILDARGGPLLTINYATEAEAERAEVAIRAAIENAIDIMR